MLAALWVMGPADERPEVVQQLAERAKASVLRPDIDQRYEAYAYFETSRKWVGSVVMSVAQVS